MNQERREQIIEMITQNRMVKNSELMSRFGISIETVRRDLEYLEQQGYLKRVYGGAVIKPSLGAEPEYARREQENYAEKKSIAIEAVKLIVPNDVVFFDLGTTVLTMSQFLKKDCQMTAFTNSLRMAIALSDLPACTVMLPGGQLRPQELTVSGFPSEENMKQFNVDKVFIGAGGISADGVTDFHTAESSLRRQVIQNARQVIVLADSDKFGIRAMNRVCSMKEVDILITDEKAPRDVLRQIERAGVRIIISKSI